MKEKLNDIFRNNNIIVKQGILSDKLLYTLKDDKKVTGNHILLSDKNKVFVVKIFDIVEYDLDDLGIYDYLNDTDHTLRDYLKTTNKALN